jgi:hypothetical protein
MVTAQIRNLAKQILLFNIKNDRFHKGVKIYSRTNYRNPNAKINFEVNWSAFGSVHSGTANAMSERLREASRLARAASGKMTEKEYREVEDEVYEERSQIYQGSALKRLF